MGGVFLAAAFTLVSWKPNALSGPYRTPVGSLSFYRGPRHRLGSGDRERKTLLTRRIAFEPLPASAFFGLLRSLLLNASPNLLGQHGLPFDHFIELGLPQAKNVL